MWFVDQEEVGPGWRKENISTQMSAAGPQGGSAFLHLRKAAGGRAEDFLDFNDDHELLTEKQ